MKAKPFIRLSLGLSWLLKRILENFYYRLFAFMGVLLITMLFPMPVIKSSASIRIWLPGYYCILIPKKAGQEVRPAFPCGGFVRASELKEFQENAVFVGVDSVTVFLPGTVYALPDEIDTEVYAVDSMLKRAFQASLILLLTGLTFADMVKKNLKP